jgi:mRNA-degrading endonuclease YafQ of YafQ-DinJ toxin-antitoxin module
MQILQTNLFKKLIKKLHANQKVCLDDAVRCIVSDPLIGVEKVGDLAGVRVYKFHIIDQLSLLAYKYHKESPSIVLLALGSHENFYRDLKNHSFND